MYKRQSSKESNKSKSTYHQVELMLPTPEITSNFVQSPLPKQNES